VVLAWLILVPWGLPPACRDGENPGDAVGEAGKRIGVAGAAGRVELADRQRSHPQISRGQRQRLFGLAEGRPGVAAVGILRQRGVDEVQAEAVKLSGTSGCLRSLW
jgi:hypothetical protein